MDCIASYNHIIAACRTVIGTGGQINAAFNVVIYVTASNVAASNILQANSA